MSIKKNTTANYIGQGYSTLIGIAITPLYLQYLGAEAYGLVGFFALMQAWLGMLDMGLSPTLGRQVAHAKGRGNGFDLFKRLLKSFELIFVGLALLIVLGIYLLSGWISQNWIQAETLSVDTLIYCVVLMGMMVGLRWFSGLYRSGINGMEDQVWLNVANIFLISFKFIGGLILLSFVTQDIRHFFEYQLVIALLEVLVFAWRLYAKLPETQKNLGLVAFDWPAVKKVTPFALGIAYTAGIWILITQTDKLILSGVLSLAEFGYFSLVALVASSITVLSGPISLAIMPRMTALLAQNKKEEMLKIYRQSSQIVTWISFSVALMIGLYGEIIIYTWTGDRQAAKWGADVLIWFALGNGVLAISAFQYYLQSAFGKLKLHVIGSTISGVIQLPVIYFAATHYGAVGAGVAWFGFRVIWFLGWTPIVHRHFVPGFHIVWLFKDLLPVIAITVLLALVTKSVIPLDYTQSRIMLFSEIFMLGLSVLCLSSLSLPALRAYIKSKFGKESL